MSEFGRLCARFGRFNLVGLMGAALQLVLLDLLMERLGLSGAAAAPPSGERDSCRSEITVEELGPDEPGRLRPRAEARRAARENACLES